MSDTIEETKPDTEVEETEETTGAGEETEYTPPSKEEWAKIQKTLAARKADVAKYRKELGEAKAKAGKVEQTDAEKAEVEQRAAATELKTKRIAGVAALVSEGLSREQAKKFVRLLNLDEVELDDDGDGDFEDAIDELKRDFPELFATKTKRPKVSTANRGDGGGNASSGNPQLDGMLKTLGLK